MNNISKYLTRLIGETAIYGIASAINGLAVLFLLPLYTREFSTAEYGIYSLMMLLTGMLTMFSCLGLDSAAIRFFFDSPDDVWQKRTIATWFWTQLLVSCILAGSCAIFTIPLQNWLGGKGMPGNQVPVLIALWSVPPAIGGIILNNLFRCQRKPIAAITATFVQTFLLLSLSILFVPVLHWGIRGIFTATLISSSFMFLAACIQLRNWLKFSLFSISLLKDMLRFSLPLIPTALCLWFMMNMDRMMLKELSNESEVGLYSVASTFALGIGILISAFSQAWGPFAYSIADKEESGSVYAATYDYYCALGIFAAVGTGLFAPLILRIFTPSEYYSAASTMGILAFGTVLNGSRYVVSLGSCIAKKTMPHAISSLIGAAVNLLLNYLLIPSYGKDGAAAATVAAWGISVIYLYCYSQHCYPIPYRQNVLLLFSCISAGVFTIDHFLWNGACTWITEICRFFLLVAFAGIAFVYFKFFHIAKREGNRT